MNEAEKSEHVVGRSVCTECIESIFSYRGGVVVGGGTAAAVWPSVGNPGLRPSMVKMEAVASNGASPVSLSVVP